MTKPKSWSTYIIIGSLVLLAALWTKIALADDDDILLFIPTIISSANKPVPEPGNTIFINPQEARFCYYKSAEGDKLTIYGIKDAEGIPLAIKYMCLVTKDGEEYLAEVDDNHELSKIITPDGQTVEFINKDADTIHIQVLDPNGIKIYEVDIESTEDHNKVMLDRPVLKKTVKSALRSLEDTRGAGRITVNVSIYKDCAQLVPIDPPQLPRVVLDNSKYLNYMERSEKGKYSAVINSSVEVPDDEKTVEYCQAQKNRASLISSSLTHIGTLISLAGVKIKHPTVTLVGAAVSVLSSIATTIADTDPYSWYYDVGGLVSKANLRVSLNYLGKKYESDPVVVKTDDFSNNGLTINLEMKIPLSDMEKCFVGRRLVLKIHWDDWGAAPWWEGEVTFNCDGTLNTDDFLIFSPEPGKWALFKSDELHWALKWNWDAYEDTYFQADIYNDVVELCSHPVNGDAWKVGISHPLPEGEWTIEE